MLQDLTPMTLAMGLEGFGDFAGGAGSYFRGLFRTARQLARSNGAMGDCEKSRSQEEDSVMQDIIAELRDNLMARALAKEGLARYAGKNGTYLKGRVTAGVGTSLVTPGGLGMGVSAVAMYGDMRRAIEDGADSAEAALAGMTGDIRVKSPRLQSNSCTCQR